MTGVGAGASITGVIFFTLISDRMSVLVRLAGVTATGTSTTGATVTAKVGAKIGAGLANGLVTTSVCCFFIVLLPNGLLFPPSTPPFAMASAAAFSILVSPPLLLPLMNFLFSYLNSSFLFPPVPKTSPMIITSTFPPTKNLAPDSHLTSPLAPMTDRILAADWSPVDLQRKLFEVRSYRTDTRWYCTIFSFSPRPSKATCAAKRIRIEWNNVSLVVGCSHYICLQPFREIHRAYARLQSRLARFAHSPPFPQRRSSTCSQRSRLNSAPPSFALRRAPQTSASQSCTLRVMWRGRT